MSRNSAALLFACACLGAAPAASAPTEPAPAAPEKKPLQFGVTARVSTL